VRTAKVIETRLKNNALFEPLLVLVLFIYCLFSLCFLPIQIPIHKDTQQDKYHNSASQKSTISHPSAFKSFSSSSTFLPRFASPLSISAQASSTSAISSGAK